MPNANSIKSSVNQGPAFGPALYPRTQARAAAKKSSLLNPTWSQAAAKVTFEKTEQLRPLSDKKLAQMKKVNQFFSLDTFKPVLKYGSIFAAGASIGAILAVFKGAALQAAFAGMVASSAFPPVMITIAVMVGVSLLAFGVYKYIQNRNEKIALNEAYKASQEANLTSGTSLADDNASLKSSVKSYKQPAPVLGAVIEESASIKAPKKPVIQPDYNSENAWA